MYFTQEVTLEMAILLVGPVQDITDMQKYNIKRIK
jgi:hypothetical protein